ncbi:MAG TPA: hypothetical protein VMM81_08885, partial [Acidimicrobiia bacterium]|nr:hypothetical protein [Acidimicrobiia bacterium]
MKSSEIQLVEAAARGFAEGLIRSVVSPALAERPVVLDSAGPLEFDAEVGEIVTGVAAVDALFDNDLRPAEGVAVRFEVVQGPLILLPDGGRAVEVRADDAGRATVDGKFIDTGFAIVVAELVDDPRVSVYFRGHSGGMTHNLFLYSAPVFSVEPGEVTARIVALDRSDRPVAGARISFEGHSDLLASAEGAVEEIGNGVYQGRFQTNIAGNWTLIARDLDDFVAAGTCVTLVPGPPARINLIGGNDPRTEQPFGELVLRARLEDRFGNGLDPSRLVASVDDQPVAALAPFGLEANLPVRFPGSGSVQVTVEDAESEVRETESIPFAAAWLQDPGAVTTGSRFSTGVFWIPERDRPVAEATVQITFDPAMVSFQGFEGAAGLKPALEAGATVEGELVSISITGERPVAAEDFPNGVFVGACHWQCLGEGESCFTVVALMSPPTDPWKLCPIQKRLPRNKKCLCVNVIYPPKDNVALTQGRKAAKQVETIISSKKNVKTCCPVIEVKTR